MRIIVLGAGYTGMTAAMRAWQKTHKRGGQVTLVNPSPRFTERLRLHQTAAGERLADHLIEDVVAGTGITFVQGRVTAIDPEAREVTVDGDRTLGYDRLVYAIGTVTDTWSTPGVADHAYTYDDHDQAVRLAARLDGLREGTVVVAGGGLTGVESATELAEAHPGLRVVLLSRAVPGSMMGERARAYLSRVMDGLGIEVRSGVEVAKVLPGGVELVGGEFVAAEATLWTAGTRALPLAADAGLTVDARGRVVVDEVLRSVSHPDVYAVGDAAAVSQPYGTIHGTCQSGIPTGLHAGDALGAEARGKDPKPFRFGYFHQPLSLGRKDGVIQFVRRDDTPRRWYITGRWAIAYKEMVSSSPLPSLNLIRRGLVPSWAFRLTA
ncbi:NAD(P)/FAD-dependent oxidoreductase [Nonomuraea sp. NPDC050556]|uniref:NAD(P)/FAD-dependent oxidoreductase n=1 Tax=Nonomuraea sp. NPDC050556 TaxID=3364369 RepID=UPI00379D57D6